jgi:hypothetical protein
VLDALGKRAGPEDLRTASQRRHDALHEACPRQCVPSCARAFLEVRNGGAVTWRAR